MCVLCVLIKWVMSHTYRLLTMPVALCIEYCSVVHVSYCVRCIGFNIYMPWSVGLSSVIVCLPAIVCLSAIVCMSLTRFFCALAVVSKPQYQQVIDELTRNTTPPLDELGTHARTRTRTQDYSHPFPPTNTSPPTPPLPTLIQ